MIKLLIVFVFMLLHKRNEVPSEAKRLKLVRFKPRQSVTYSNKQKFKWITSLWKLLDCRKSVGFEMRVPLLTRRLCKKYQPFEWNNLRSLGKALVYLHSMPQLTQHLYNSLFLGK